MCRAGWWVQDLTREMGAAVKWISSLFKKSSEMKQRSKRRPFVFGTLLIWHKFAVLYPSSRLIDEGAIVDFDGSGKRCDEPVFHVMPAKLKSPMTTILSLSSI